MINLYIFYMDSGMKTKETKKIYKSTLSFYKSIKYLQEAGFIFKRREKDNTNKYFLTLKGEILARCLCSLPENPDSWRKLGMKLRFKMSPDEQRGSELLDDKDFKEKVEE
jgi:DNA-binding PadR family transcriptional regulator